MTGLPRALLYSSVGLLGVLLSGLLARRLYRVCYSFTVYVAVVMVGDLLLVMRPDRFSRWEFFQIKESVYALLKLATALELAALTFGAFPGARRTARLTLLLVLTVTLVVAVSWGGGGTDAASIAQELQPRLRNCTAATFVGLWGLVLWYNLPVHPFHRAILRGIVPYTLVSTVTLRLVRTLGWGARERMGNLDSTAYLLMLAYWCWRAWRTGSDLPPADPDLVHRLQPWRGRL